MYVFLEIYGKLSINYPLYPLFGALSPRLTGALFLCRLWTELQIRGSIEDNSKIIFLIS